MTIIFLLTALLLAGCTSQKPVVVVPNDTIKVHYTASLASNGQQFESSLNGTPIEFVAGSGMVIKGFDNAVLGMSVGQNKTITVPADQAYGPKRQDLIITTEKTGSLADYEPKPGTITYITVPFPDGTVGRFPIIASNETTVTVDMNHPLAGQDLVFNIQLVDIVN
ncbi:MAG: FKBP-type peptidyl-prolyl cis-trans isomerase [Methanoregulaceae archaeon]|nr:FKBP-type peptidyl-prolyl cis-trans isomerase [Methanoregulaceae archaeon]